MEQHERPFNCRLPGGRERIPVAPEIRARVIKSALAGLTPRQRQTTNLHIDPWVVEPGTKLGPSFQSFEVRSPSVLVFADEDPLANFGHSCRFLLHDEEGVLAQRVLSQFPPYPFSGLDVLEPIYIAVKAAPVEPEKCARPAETLRTLKSCTVMRTPAANKGRRFAILFSGATDARHLNDLELSYRMLTQVYGVDPKHVFALIHDGTRGANGVGPFVDGTTGALRPWPGGTGPGDDEFLIQLTGPGTKAAFQEVRNRLVTEFKLNADDLLFIHVEGHGAHFSGEAESMCRIVTFPSILDDSDEYFAWEMQNDLGPLACGSLLVLMNQCYSGGFKSSVLAGSSATATCIACACQADLLAYATMDGKWNDFSLDWLQAQMGFAVNTKAPIDANRNNDPVIQAWEAFRYAADHIETHVDSGSDTPNFASEPYAIAQDIALSA